MATDARPVGVAEEAPPRPGAEALLDGGGTGNGDHHSGAETSEWQAPPEAAKAPLPEIRVRTLLALLCAVCALEGADAMLLPASFTALEEHLGMTPVHLGSMSLAQALMQALASPIWGLLASNDCISRRAILAIGCTGWGLASLTLSACSSLGAMVLLRAFEGSMLACLSPITQGIVADVTPENRRGRVLGLLQFSMNLGGMVVFMVATPMSRQIVLGFQGWRVAFAIVAIISLVTGAALLVIMEDPPREGGSLFAQDGDAKVGPREALQREAWRLWGYLRTPTFAVIILQGVFGSIPWNALGFTAMYFQKAGLSDLQASSLASISPASCALGTLLGGMIGDAMAQRCPNHGRAFTAQISVVSGIPLVALIFWYVTPSPQSFGAYAVLLFILGVSSSWCGVGVNWPILSEIVEPEGRSVILAWDRALEGASAALFGAPAVGFLAEHCFGYHLDSSDNTGGIQKARALGSALVVATVGPWLVCLASFSILHYSYPRDRAKAAANAQARSAASSFAAASSPTALPPCSRPPLNGALAEREATEVAARSSVSASRSDPGGRLHNVELVPLRDQVV